MLYNTCFVDNPPNSEYPCKNEDKSISEILGAIAAVALRLSLVKLYEIVGRHFYL